MDLATLLSLSRLKLASRSTINKEMIKCYKQQIERLYRIGIGNETEYHTIVSERLISVYRRRLNELIMENHVGMEFIGTKKRDANI